MYCRIKDGLDKITCEVFYFSADRYHTHKDHVKALIKKYVDSDIMDWQVDIILQKACMISTQSARENLADLKRAILQELT